MIKVLLVEDEDMIRKGLAYTFNWAVQDCILIGEAKNGRDGLEKIQSLQPDIVITDISMPIMNGIEMIQNAQKDYRFASIIISGYEEFHLAQKAITLGVTDYLLKPLDHSELIVAIQNCKKRLKEIRIAETIETDQPTVSVLPQLSQTSSTVVSAALLFIQNNFKEKFGIQDMADALDVSYATLSNRFKEETRCTINDYLNRYRIQKSIELMMKGEETIYIIANEVGFQDYKYFISVFKKYVNHTPSTFIQNILSLTEQDSEA